ncbi:hypothetical protein WICMUC_004823 [Wickerhamomyces mucosus]|uniref:Thioesterase domain-containing protein n=1 Tax=Wickerhamomyces mucosus TaxID=1378264 RepID=A0A9P8PG69_9ASCO|nr:hypothetical protein WICMUC_004823 [Wickerhamomyces mucosus]
MSFSNTIKYLFFVFAISTYKSLPGAYYFRIYWVFLKNLYLYRLFPQFKYNVNNVFQTQELHSYNSPLECDFYLHKSNSCYVEELDIARSELMTSNLQRFFTEYETKSGQFPFVPVASIWTSFKKEIKPFERYSIKSKIAAWDEKWIFILSKFVKNNDQVASVTITKYVLKDGRKTIRPFDAFKFQGIWTEDAEKTNQKNLKKVEFFIDNHEIEELDI